MTPALGQVADGARENLLSAKTQGGRAATNHFHQPHLCPQPAWGRVARPRPQTVIASWGWGETARTAQPLRTRNEDQPHGDDR